MSLKNFVKVFELNLFGCGLMFGTCSVVFQLAGLLPSRGSVLRWLA